MAGVRLTGAAASVMAEHPRRRGRDCCTLLGRHGGGGAAAARPVDLRARRGTLGPRQHRPMHAAARQRPQQQQQRQHVRVVPSCSSGAHEAYPTASGITSRPYAFYTTRSMCVGLVRVTRLNKASIFNSEFKH